MWHTDSLPAKETLTTPHRYRLSNKTATLRIQDTTDSILTSHTPTVTFQGPTLPQTTDTPPWTFTQPHIDTMLTQYNKQEQPHVMQTRYNELKDSTYKHHTRIYTDGSLNPETEKTGIGIYFPAYKNISATLTQHLSIFTAELTAIRTAIRTIYFAERIQPSKGTSKYLIATDSLSSLQAMQNQDSERSDLVFQILDELTELRKKEILVDFIWVPSHIGIHGNEKADQLARLATLETTHDTRQEQIQYLKTHLEVAVSPAEKKAVIKKLLNASWTKRYKDEVKGRRKLLSQAPSNKLVIFNSHRSCQSRIARMRLGAERNLFRQERYVCHCGQAEVNTQHVLFECALNCQTRTELEDILHMHNLKLTLETALNPPDKLWNLVLDKVSQIVGEHPQGTDI